MSSPASQSNIKSLDIQIYDDTVTMELEDAESCSDFSDDFNDEESSTEYHYYGFEDDIPSNQAVSTEHLKNHFAQELGEMTTVRQQEPSVKRNNAHSSPKPDRSILPAKVDFATSSGVQHTKNRNMASRLHTSSALRHPVARENNNDKEISRNNDLGSKQPNTRNELEVDESLLGIEEQIQRMSIIFDMDMDQNTGWTALQKSPSDLSDVSNLLEEMQNLGEHERMLSKQLQGISSEREIMFEYETNDKKRELPEIQTEKEEINLHRQGESRSRIIIDNDEKSDEIIVDQFVPGKGKSSAELQLEILKASAKISNRKLYLDSTDINAIETAKEELFNSSKKKNTFSWLFGSAWTYRRILRE